MPVARGVRAVDEPIQRARACLSASIALLVDPAVQLRGAVDVEVVEKGPAVFRDRLLQATLAQRDVERVDVAGEQIGVEPKRFTVRDDGARAEILSERIQQLRERMSRAGVVTLGPQQCDDARARDDPSLRGGQVSQQSQPPALAVSAAEWRTVALQVNGSERPQPQRHMAFDTGKADFATYVTARSVRATEWASAPGSGPGRATTICRS